MQKMLAIFFTFLRLARWRDAVECLQHLKTAFPAVYLARKGAPAGVEAIPPVVLRLEKGCGFGFRWSVRAAGHGFGLKGTDGCPSLLGLSQGVGVAWGSNAVCYHLLFREIGP